MENKLSDRRRIDMTKVRRMSGLQAVSGMLIPWAECLIVKCRIKFLQIILLTHLSTPIRKSRNTIKA